MSVESWSYQKDGKRSLNEIETLSLIKVHSLYLKCVQFVWKNQQLLLGQPNSKEFMKTNSIEIFWMMLIILLYVQ